MRSILDWLKFLNPANILLLKQLVDAVEAVVRLLERLFGNPGEEEKDK